MDRAEYRAALIHPSPRAGREVFLTIWRSKMRRIAFAGLLGAVVLFVWSAVSWMALPFHNASTRPLPSEVATALSQHVTEPGAYAWPPMEAPAKASAVSEWEASFERGPWIPLLVYHPEPATSGGIAAPLARSFLIDLVAATLAAVLLAVAAPRLAGYRERVLFVASLGVFAAVITSVEDMSWGYQDMVYGTVLALEAVVGWTLVGLVQAGMVRAAPLTTAAPRIEAAHAA
jgi:hypothetical protein